MDVVTLGMFIIDEIHHPPPKPPDKDVMGGGGLYTALGARLFRPPPSSSKVGWIIHEGHDFPPELKQLIQSWRTSCLFISTPDRPTTRARNTYGPGEHRCECFLVRSDHPLGSLIETTVYRLRMCNSTFEPIESHPGVHFEQECRLWISSRI